MKYVKLLAYMFVGALALVGALFVGVFVAMHFGLLNVRGSASSRDQFFTDLHTPTDAPCSNTVLQQCSWMATPEWATIKAGLTKDAATIQKVSAQTSVSARLIAAVAVPEQIRFFTAEREVYKRYFEPLKILGSLSQFSLGVSGVKQETAKQIEAYAADTTSPFYPGDGMSALIAYKSGDDHDTVLFNRLTDPKDHYYSYLYTALYIKEIEAQWRGAGFDITKTPGAIVTLFNIGFAASHPNAHPQLAGAAITTGGMTYSYGQLGQNFYDSGELTNIFPK